MRWVLKIFRSRFAPLALLVWALAPARLPAQAPVWRIADHLASEDQWTLYGRDAQAGVRGLPVTAGDFNGDGLADVAFMGTLTDTWIVLSDGLGGEFDLLDVDPDSPPPRVVRLVRAPDGYAGEVNVGDFNGDGIEDLVIGSQTSDSSNPTTPITLPDAAGAVYILWGNPALGGQVIDLADVGLALPDGITVTKIVGVSPGYRVGLWVSRGRVDGDPIDDLLFTADETPGDPSNPVPYTGSAYVAYGMMGQGSGTLFGPAGFLNVIALDSLPALTGLSVIHGVDGHPTSSLGDHFGSTVSFGDLDGNLRDEVIVSAALDRSGATVGGSGAGAAAADGIGNARLDAGETYIIWDKELTGRNVTLDLRLAPPASLTRVIGPRSREFTGEEVWTSDLDGDGRRDLLIGAIVANGGRGGLWIIYNDGTLEGKTIDLNGVDPATGRITVDGDSIRTAEMRGTASGDIFADTVRTSDLNGDGLQELIIGLPSHGNAKVFIFFAKPGGDRFPPLLDFQTDPTLQGLVNSSWFPLRILEIASGDTMSYSMHVGDFNGDGRPDVLINGMLAPARGGTGPGLPSRPGQAYFISGAALTLAAGAPLTSNDASRSAWPKY